MLPKAQQTLPKATHIHHCQAGPHPSLPLANRFSAVRPTHPQRAANPPRDHRQSHYTAGQSFLLVQNRNQHIPPPLTPTPPAASYAATFHPPIPSPRNTRALRSPARARRRTSPRSCARRSSHPQTKRAQSSRGATTTSRTTLTTFSEGLSLGRPSGIPSSRAKPSAKATPRCSTLSPSRQACSAK